MRFRTTCLFISGRVLLCIAAISALAVATSFHISTRLLAPSFLAVTLLSQSKALLQNGDFYLRHSRKENLLRYNAILAVEIVVVGPSRQTFAPQVQLGPVPGLFNFLTAPQ